MVLERGMATGIRIPALAQFNIPLLCVFRPLFEFPLYDFSSYTD